MNFHSTPSVLAPEAEKSNAAVEAPGLAPALIEKALGQAKALQDNVILLWEGHAPQCDPLLWLESESSPPSFYWKGRYQQTEFAGAQAALVLRGTGPGSLIETCSRADAIFERRIIHPSLPRELQPRFWGGFAFDPHYRSGDKWSGFDDAVLIFPEALLVRSGTKNRLLLAVTVHPDQTTDDVIHSTERLIARYQPSPSPVVTTIPAVQSSFAPDVSQETWTGMVRAALARIKDGSINKIVLSRQLWLRGIQLAAWPVMRRLRDRVPSCFHFAFNLGPDRSFVGATPECLFYRSDADVETECIAGTILRGDDPQSDQALAEHLLTSPKDRLEHYFVIDDALACLGHLCDRLDAGTSPQILKLATLQHLMTRARGHLKAGTSTGDILASLHPTPAVGGSPRDKALEAIRELEPESRGWYAGPVGWYAPDRAEFAVAIRSALLTESGMCIFAGAGIVQGSTPEEEWRETDAKALAFLNALQ